MAELSKYFDPMMEMARESIRQGQTDVVGFMQQIAQRQGHLGAMRMAANATAPFAREIGLAGAKAAEAAAEQQRLDKLFEEQKRQWEAQFAENQKQAQQAYELQKQQYETNVAQAEKNARMAALGYTGFNPLIMQDLGYSTMKYPQFSEGTNLQYPAGTIGRMNTGMGFQDLGYGGMNYPRSSGFGGSGGISTMKYQPGLNWPGNTGSMPMSPSQLFYARQQNPNWANQQNTGNFWGP